MKKFKMLLLFFIFFVFGFSSSLTSVQINKIITAYKIGKQIKAKDGITFGYTLPSIMGVETSFGKYYVGDRYQNGRLKSLYLASLGNFQIRLKTARFVLKHNKGFLRYRYLLNPLGGKVYPLYEKTKKEYESLSKITNIYMYRKYKIDNFLKHNKYYKKYLYFKSIFNSKIWNKRAKRGSKRAIATLKWAKKNMIFTKKMYKKELKKFLDKNSPLFLKEFINIQNKKLLLKERLVLYQNFMRRDVLLINKLLGDFNFSAKIAGYYLKDIYNEALNKRFKHPYIRAVGRYNGGWNNYRYFRRVMKEMKIVKRVIKHQN